jgi:hypothetical protein
MRVQILKVVTTMFVLCVAASGAQAKEKDFNKPKWKGDRLDWCLNWAAGCGKDAADAFCKANGYENASKFEQDPDIGSSHKTRLITTGAVCDQSSCDGFKSITCSKSEPDTVVIDKPEWKGDRLDWCLNWTAGCGKDAADAFCKAGGYANSTKFEQDPDIGGSHKTRIMTTGAVCDQSSCDGFKFIECQK